MEIYKLNYTDKETAIADLLAKGVYVEVENLDKEITLQYGKGVQAIVEIGKIVLENGTYDAEFNVITEAVYTDGYAFDVMSDIEIVFESEIFPNNPVHSFAGCVEVADEYIPNDLIIGLKIENRKK
jgi:uncharacterized protein (UPF0333 family)